MEPRLEERYRRRGGVAHRISQLKAVHRPERTTADGAAWYYSARYEVWLGILADGDGFLVRYYDDCPCSG